MFIFIAGENFRINLELQYFILDKTTVVKCPKQVIYEETEYTKMFQEFFADGISLKKEIVKKIKG